MRQLSEYGFSALRPTEKVKFTSVSSAFSCFAGLGITFSDSFSTERVEQAYACPTRFCLFEKVKTQLSGYQISRMATVGIY